jgi:hypothetical protein
MKQQLPNFGSLRDLGISCDGNKVTMTVIKRTEVPDSNLYIWNLEKDSFGFFDFEKGFNDIDEGYVLDNPEENTAYEK